MSSAVIHYSFESKDQLLPAVGHFQEQWLAACKNPGLKTACDFEYSGDMIEQMLLGLLDRSVDVACCGTCCIARGLAEGDIVPGVRVETIHDLAAATARGDKVVSF